MRKTRGDGLTAALLLVLSLVFVSAAPARAEIGLIVQEPIGALGFFTRVGHTGVYLSDICPDGSPVRMRLCAPGERGGVLSKYSLFSEYEDYDWAIMPFDEYMHGFGSPDLAPLFGTPGLQRVIEDHDFGELFAQTLKSSSTGRLPEGQWRKALATRFDRTLYIFSVATSPTDAAAIVAAFNGAANKSRFNFFYRNCSDQAKGIFDLMWPDDKIGNRTSGVTMQTPKGLAKALVDRAETHPDLHLRVRRYSQLPGTYPRSRPVLFPMENTYKSIAFAPWWFFGGFREVALVSMLYHQVVTPFSVITAAKDFITPRAAQLTLEQHRLGRQQDQIRLVLATSGRREPPRPTLLVLNASVFRRLGEIAREKQAEIDRVQGSARHWQALEREFAATAQTVDWRHVAPRELAEAITTGALRGQSSNRLFRYFDTHGEFYVDRENRGPWMRLAFDDGRIYATGLSMSHVGEGDPRVAALIQVAVLDDVLHERPAHRANVETVDGLFAAFTRAARTLPRKGDAGIGLRKTDAERAATGAVTRRDVSAK